MVAHQNLAITKVNSRLFLTLLKCIMRMAKLEITDQFLASVLAENSLLFYFSIMMTMMGNKSILL